MIDIERENDRLLKSTNAISRSRRPSGRFWLYVILFMQSLVAIGQDSHYWNIQYGTKATLLGGMVIGSVSDLSATYYNPGAISLFENPKLIISAKVYEFERITIDDGAGLNQDLVSDKIATAPNFFAMKIKMDSTENNKLAISVLTRQYMDMNFSTTAITQGNNPATGAATTSGYFKGNAYLNEMWGGISFSHKVNENIGLGVTGYGVYRYQTLMIQSIVEELETTNQISSYVNFKNIDYTNYRALLKAGLAVKLQPFTMGLTVTTPSLNVLGSGHFGYGKIINEPDTVANNVYQTSYQDSLKTIYKSSWAIGIGAAYWHEKYNIHVSAEWYNAVKDYHPMVVQPFVAQSSGEIIQKEVNHELNSVLNFGVGLDYNINKKTSVSGGFTTDYSAKDTDVVSNISLTKWNIYHVSAGSNFQIGKTEITLGLSYSFGKNLINQQVDINNITRFNNAIKPNVNTEFTRIKLLFGFIF